MYVVICQNTQLMAAGKMENVRGVNGWIPFKSSFFATNPTFSISNIIKIWLKKRIEEHYKVLIDLPS